MSRGSPVGLEMHSCNFARTWYTGDTRGDLHHIDGLKKLELSHESECTVRKIYLDVSSLTI